MLDKEFVPHQESLELKELGFDEPCFGSWETEYVKVPTYTHEISQFYKNSNHPIGKVTAPTFSQAFRWFRENYGLRIRNYGSINYSKELSEYFEIFKYGHGTSDKSLSIEVGALTYEEAELACLRKLIEIVKQQKLNHDLMSGDIVGY